VSRVVSSKISKKLVCVLHFTVSIAGEARMRSFGMEKRNVDMIQYICRSLLLLLPFLLLLLEVSQCFAQESGANGPEPVTAQDRALGGATIYGEAQYDPELDALFQKAMEKRKKGDLEGAIEGFKAILARHPEFHRARLELAVAYYQARRFSEAITEAEEVLKDQTLPANVRVTVLAFLSQVKADSQVAQSRHNWRFPVEFGYLYDTNATAGPSSYVREGFEPLDERYTKKSDAGVVASAGVDHTYQTGKKIKIAGSEANLLWQSGLSAYYRAYIEEHDNNFSVYSVRTGPNLVVMRSWRANINFQYDYLRYGEDDLANYYYIVPSFTVHATDALEISTDLEFNRRDFIQDEDDGRDSIFLLGRLYARYTFPNGRVALSGGIELFTENADDDQFSNDGEAYFAGGTWRFYDRSDLFARVRRWYADYNDPPPGFDKARDENEWRITAGINHTFDENKGMLALWKVELKLVYTDLESNLDLYDYDRAETLFTLSRTF